MYSYVYFHYDYLVCIFNCLLAIPCRVGDNPKGTTEYTAQGTYLNTQYPAQCNGTVTSWHYCYYPSGADDHEETYTAFIALWRHDATLDQYTIVDGSVSDIQIQGVEMPHDIYCTQHLLDSDNHVEIRTGDVVGVLLPEDLPIPMIGSGNTYWIKRDDTNRMSPANITDTTFNFAWLAIHLYADITETGKENILWQDS